MSQPFLHAVQNDVAAALQQADIETAFSIYEKAIDRAATPELLAEYGALLWHFYEFERGTELFQRVLESSDANIDTLKKIAKAFFQIGRFQQAASVMKIAVDCSEDSKESKIESLELYAGALERDNQKEAAREQAERAIALDPNSNRATRLLAHLDKRAGDYEQAIRRLRDHLKAYPSGDDWRLRYELAASLDRTGDYDAAWKELLLAKEQLRPITLPHLRESHRIRSRQWDFAKQVTPVDLKNWQTDQKEIGLPVKLTFLAGFPRSGTTLLEQILSSHNDAIGTDETGILSNQFTQTLVWQAATSDDALIELRSFHADTIVEGRSKFLQWTQAFLDEPIGERLLIEKDPLLTPDLAMGMRLFPEASVLMPLRDPRDVIVSYFFTMVPLNWNSAPSTSILEASRFYFDCMRHWVLWRERLPIRLLETRYEAIIESPAEEIQKVVQFLGLSWDETMLDVKQRSSRKAVRTPTYDDIAKPLYKRAINRWKNYEKHLGDAFEVLTPLLQAFEYE